MKRHRRKFIFTGVVIGGAYVLSKYARKKLQEIQDKEAAECIAFAKRQHHFESNQRTCNMTVLSMLPTMREALMNAMDTESITAQLKAKPSNKLELWEELKILSFTRSICAVYTSCMLIVVLRVQLNIIGGYMYLDSLKASENPDHEKLVATPVIQHRYLEKIQHILGAGLQMLVAEVQRAVHNSISSISLKEYLTLSDVQTIIERVRKHVEFRQENGYHDASATSLCKYMFACEPDVDEACSLSKEQLFMSRVFRETQDVIESGDFHSVISTCLDTGFTRLLDKIAESYKHTPEEGTTINVNEVSLAMAKLIPIINGLIHTVCGDAPNIFIQELLLKEPVKDFAANVYEAFSQVESSCGPG